MPKKAKVRVQLPSDLDAFDSRLHGESDRGAALIAAALLDAQLESLFRRRLKHHQDRLLGIDGALATFANRTRVARALEWIDTETEHDLDLIRNIRNKFAHSFEQDLTFENVEVQGWCSSLLLIQTYLKGFDRARDRLRRNFSLEVISAWRKIMEPPRWRYLIATNWLAQHLKEVIDSTWDGEPLIAQIEKLGERFNVRIQATATGGAPVASPRADA